MTHKAQHRGTGASTVGDKKASVQCLVDKWKPILGLEKWIVNIHIQDGYDPEEDDIQADITEDLRYFEAELNIWKQFWDDEPWKQEVTIVHELVHLLLCPLHQYLPPAGDEEVERVTQTIALRFIHNQKVAV